MDSLAFCSLNFETPLQRTHVVRETKTIIGRSSACDVVLNSKLVSRKHCKITCRNVNGARLIKVENMSSCNCVFINGFGLKSNRGYELKCGDTVGIANAKFTVTWNVPTNATKNCAKSENSPQTKEGEETEDGIEQITAEMSDIEYPTAGESEPEIPTVDEGQGEDPTADESEIEIFIADESEEEVPTADESEIEVPTADESEEEVPTADESEEEIPTADESEEEIPTADESEIEIPTADESEEEIPTAGESSEETPTEPEEDSDIECLGSDWSRHSV